MNMRRLSALILAGAMFLALSTYVIVTAQGEGGRPYPEGQAPQATLGSSTGEQPVQPRTEGQAPNGVGGSGTFDPANLDIQKPMGGGGLPLLYQFSGVRDDGAKSVDGKSATSLHCSNPTAASVAMSYYVYNFAGTTYYYFNYNVPAFHTFTITTQYTNVYTEDYVLRASGTSDYGTGPIDQGLGLVYSGSPEIICTVQVHDPTGNPPAFAVELEMFR